MKHTLALSLIASLVLSACSDPSSTVAAKSNGSQQQVASSPQEQLNNFANTLKVEYQLVSNIADEQCNPERTDGSCFHVQMSFTSVADFNLDNWQIYFSQINPVQSVNSDIFSIEHINGDLHKITAKPSFDGFKAGQRYDLNYRVDFWSLSETDALPNYIVHLDNLQAQVITSTTTQIDPETGLEIYPFVIPYTSVDKHFNRTPSDQTKWATAQVLYERNKQLLKPTNELKNSLIPTPKNITSGHAGESLDLSKGINIVFNNVDHTAMQTALARLNLLGVKQNDKGIEVNLSLNEALTGELGSYQLNTNKSGISISANNNLGVFYGLQTIASLVSINDLSMPALTINDEPHYQFRGMMVDVARNFHSKQFLLDLIDQMAAYKLNKLHLHLGDDEGWRLEIKDLPELTQLSSKRCFDLSEQSCLLPQLGAGINPKSPVNGYYSTADYIEILQYANARHIQVIPSLDMPGHSRSSIVAMKSRYNTLMEKGDEQGAKQYLLHDPNDTTVYSSVQYYNDNTINACMESSYAFISKVMDEVKALHTQAGQELTRYHIGADETAGAWVESPICKEFIKNNDLGITETEQLGSYFVERVAKILTERNIETAGWNDGMMHTNPENMPEVVQANSWGVLSWQGHQAAHTLGNQNWEVVVSSPDVTYFDFPYEADPKEHGYYWATRQSNTQKLFEFMPDNLPAHAEFWLDRQGKPYQANDQQQINEQGEITSAPLNKGRKFAGIQGQLWSENTRNDDLAEYKIFPRLFALAERAWHKPDWAVDYDHQGGIYNQQTNKFTKENRRLRDQQWADFTHVIANKELPKLEKSNIFYRIPTVGASIIDGQLHINSAYPGLPLEYKTESEPWKIWHEPVKVQGEILVRARSVDSRRAGRLLILNK